MSKIMLGLIFLSTISAHASEKCWLNIREYRVNSGCNLATEMKEMTVTKASAEECQLTAIKLSQTLPSKKVYRYTAIDKPFHCKKTYMGPDIGHYFIDWEYNDGVFNDSNGSVNKFTESFDNGLLGNRVYDKNGNLLF